MKVILINMIKKIPYIITFILASVCFILNANAEEKIDKNDIFTRYVKDMPKLQEISDEDFKKQSKLIHKKPYGQKDLEYSIRIPNSWKVAEEKTSSNFNLSKKLFLNLNVFYGKPNMFGRSRIEIQALNLEKMLTAEQWYLKYLLDSGYTTEGFVVHNYNRVEALIIVMEGDIPYYLRTLVVLNGDKVLLVNYYVPSSDMQSQASVQAKVIESFSVKNNTERENIELDKYVFLDIAELYFPKGWNVYAKPFKDIDRLNVIVLSERKFTDSAGYKTVVNTEGKIYATVVSASAQPYLINEIQAYKKKIEKNGILLGDRIKLKRKLTYGEDMDFAITEVYKGIDSSNKNAEYEFWITIMVGGNYYYFITLLTPSRSQRFGVWADNTQNYRLIMKEFTPISGAFIKRDF